MPSRNTIEIVINATDNASRIFNSIAGETQKLGKTIGIGITAGLATATTAITGFAVAGLREFMSFEQGMQEVFSLLPGISQDAMDEMDSQVKYISERFGTLPEQVIPAFYEALSAGIPQDNVFNFVQVANKAAIAGVTDLATAVNGISSAMNAYGHDVLDAGKASDIMFQTVKLGKTTFEELSNSLYNVSPTAAALGVSFEDLNAQIAAITAQGVPTSVATNQMRQMFVELSKAGGKTADTFQQLAGKTFKQFIAEGGNTQQALQLLEKHAQETGVGINDLFSSVEAGSAALSLTGRNTERFSDFLAQMADSAGSTEEAFKTMSESLQFQLNRTIAKFRILLITVGEKLAPAFARPIEVVGNLIGWFTDLIDGGTSLTDFMSYDIPKAFRPFLMIALKVRDRIFEIIDVFQKMKSIFLLASGDLFTFVYIAQQIFPDNIITKIANFVYLFEDVINVIKDSILTIVDWIKETYKVQDVLIVIGIALSSVLIPAIIGLVASITPLIVTFGLLVTAVMLLRKAWEKNFLGIRDITKKVFNSIGDFFQGDLFKGIVNRVKDAFDTIKNIFSGGLGENPLDNMFGDVRELPIIGGLISKFETLRDALIPLFDEIGIIFSRIFGDVSLEQIVKIGSTLLSLTNPLGIIKLLFEQITGISVFDILIEGINKFTELLHNLNSGMGLLEALGITEDSNVGQSIGQIEGFIASLVDFVVNQAIPGLQRLGDWFLNDVLPKVVGFIQGTVLPAISDFINGLIGIWNDVSPFLGDLANWFLTDILPAIMRYINDVAIPIIEDVIGWLQDLWLGVQPYLQDLYNWFINTALPEIINFLENTVTPVINTFITLLQDVWNLVSPVISNLVDWFVRDGLPQIITYLNNTFKAPFEGFINMIKTIWDVVRPGIDAFKSGLESAFNWIKTNVIDPIAQRIEEFRQTLINLGIIAGNTQSAIAGVSSNPSQAVTDPSGLFGNYNGLAFAPRTQARIVHQGERIMTAQENKDYTASQNQSSTPMIHIENLNLGDIKNQSDANEKAMMFVNGLRAQGMEIG